jgi:aminoglycoside 3-N-acetyltransferase I
MLEYIRLGQNDVALMRGLNALFAEAFEDPHHYASAPPDAAYLEARLADPNIIVLVGTDNGAVVGGLVAYLLPKLEQHRSEIYIYDLAVAETHRRRGIATGLIDQLRAIGRERGAWVVYVQADYGDEPANALYTKIGVREDVVHFDIEVAEDEQL